MWLSVSVCVCHIFNYYNLKFEKKNMKKKLYYLKENINNKFIITHDDDEKD